MNKVTTDGAPKADHILSQAIISNGLIFLAGQVHNKPDGSMVDESVEAKVKQIFNNIEAILKAAGSDLSNIIKVTIYVTDMSQMLKLNKVYPTYLKEPYPAREAMCVKELPLGATIEMSVVAER